jgi:TPR repeat protein
MGLKTGDVIVRVNGTEVSTGDEASARLRQLNLGEAVELAVWRPGGMRFLTGRYETAYSPDQIEKVRFDADKGDAAAQSYLGGMYRSGDGVARDERLAVDWYRKAAASGNAAAMSSLGAAHKTGRGGAEGR